MPPLLDASPVVAGVSATPLRKEGNQVETVKLTLMIDPRDAGDIARLRSIQRAALVRARLLEILDEEDDAELATRLEVA